MFIERPLALFQKIDVGPDAKTPPENAASLTFSSCSEVNFRPRLLNTNAGLRDETQ